MHIDNVHMTTKAPHVELQTERLEQAMREHGFESVRAFADALGVHRNTVHNYLHGRATLPDAFVRMLVALDLDPGEVLRLRRPSVHVPALRVADLVDELAAVLPEAAIVLFGSRARGDAKPHSDYDLGVFRSGPLEFTEYSRALDVVEEWNERSLSRAQLVDLVRADPDFVVDIADDLRFLAGSLRAWCDLLRKAGRQVHE